MSNTFTDEMFMVPQGCSTIEMTAQKNGGRGIVTSIPPTRPSGYRGELEISDDGFGAADVYDVTVTLTCQNMAPTEGVTAGSTGSYNARISCAAQSQSTAQTTSYGFTNSVDSQSSCKMGRAEVYNPTARHPDGAGQGTWGTVCGHWFCKPAAATIGGARLRRSRCQLNRCGQGTTTTGQKSSAESWASSAAWATPSVSAVFYPLSRSWLASERAKGPSPTSFSAPSRATATRRGRSTGTAGSGAAARTASVAQRTTA